MPASCGQHFRIGNSFSEKLSVLTTSLQAPELTDFGKNEPISASFGSILTFSRKPCGRLHVNEGVHALRNVSRDSTSSAMHMRFSVPDEVRDDRHLVTTAARRARRTARLHGAIG